MCMAPKEKQVHTYAGFCCWYIRLNRSLIWNKTEDPSVPAAGIGYLNGNTQKQCWVKRPKAPKDRGPRVSPKHPWSAPKCPRSSLDAAQKHPQSGPKAAPKQPQSGPKAAPKQPQSSLKAAPKWPKSGPKTSHFLKFSKFSSSNQLSWFLISISWVFKPFQPFSNKKQQDFTF